ncbi:hypothetical protein AMK59_8638 [Oryctes borbonicus]|uniref:Ribosome biogenesis protein NOP53 n=1 Tax=Oryctes borbonicus TaxID=1629725 RepID=A0A0T6ATR0_9SCAR|nr:hypothetical protein AMK59_8638 [Oryctes borbonicus]
MERQLLTKLEKKKSADIHKLNTINVQIENLEKKLEKQKLRKEKLKSFKSKEPKQLGKLKYEEPDTVFSMKEDLGGNLKNLKVKGNLLSDRFTSFPRNHLRTHEERMCPILKSKETERKLKGILKFQERQSINDRKKHEAKLKEMENDGFSKDIWDIQNTLDQDQWIDKLTKRHILRGTGKLIKVSAKLKTDKNTAIPNIEIPHPGISYNPSFKDHTDLLMEIAEKETKIIKEEEHIKRVTKNMFKNVSAGETNNIWIKEMSQGLHVEEHLCNESESDVGDDKPYKSVNAPVENKKLKTDKNTGIPNIEIPHPGISYNPSFKDHTDLLMEIAEKETKIIKEEEHIKRVTKNMFKKVSAGETNNIWIKEMSQGLPMEEHLCDESESDLGDDKPYKSVNAPVENKKKTRKQRRKQEEQLLLMERQLLAKLEKKKSADIHKLNTINVQIENLEKKLEKQKLRKEKLKSFKSKKPKQLGKLKYEEPDTVFSMKEDLSGNLRNLKVKGNLLSDRFTSFQKRNILAVTARHNRRKSKVKKFVKPGFKDDWKTTIAGACILPTRK